MNRKARGICILFILVLTMFILSITRFAKAAGPSINLPPGAVTATFNYPGPSSYWKITLSGVPSGYDVANGAYVGWCCDQTNEISNGAQLSVTLYSSYAANNPWKPGNKWNKVNYIINNKQDVPANGVDNDNDPNNNLPGIGSGNNNDVQFAVWHYIDSNGGWQQDPDVQAMENSADANPNFAPTPGQLLAVVVYLAGSQATFIEVTVRAQLTLGTNPAGVNSPTGSGFYDAGSSAQISTPQDVDIVSGSSRYDFRGWQTSDMSEITAPSAASTTVLMDKDKTVTANYVIQYYLTVKTDPSGIGIIPGAGWYDQSSTVTLTAPIKLGKYCLISNPFSWDVDGTSKGVAISITVTMNSAHTATAHYIDPSVGGQWSPITLQTAIPMNTLQLMAPWIAIALVAAASAIATYRRFIRKHW